MVTRAEQDNLINSLSKKFDKELLEALIKAFDEIRDQITLDEIIGFLNDGDIEGVIALLSDDLFQDVLTEETSSILGRAFLAGAVLAGIPILRKAIPDIQIGVSQFSLTNATILNDQISTRVTQLSNQAQIVARAAIIQGLQNNDPIGKIALAVRNTIGLNAKQQIAASNFRFFLETGSAEVLRRKSRDKRFDSSIRAMLAGERQLSSSQIDRMVLAFERKLLRNRSITIARTETLRAVNQGKERVIQQAVEEGKLDIDRVKRFWINSGDDKVRNSHNAIPILNAIGVGLLQPFTSPLGPIRFPTDPQALPENTINCFLPDTKIEGNITTALKAFYSGDVITIKTRSRRKFTITPNHPILTNGGFVPARSLNKGDNLFCKRNEIKESVGVVSSDKQNTPTNASEIFSSLSNLFPTFRSECGAMDFDGDGEFVNSNIEVIFINSFLQNAFISLSNQRIKNFFFIHPNIQLGFLMSQSSFKTSFIRINSSSTCLMSSTNLSHNSLFPLGLNSSPLLSLCFGSSSTFNSIFQKYSSYTSSTGPKKLADAILRLSRLIETDDIIDIKVSHYEGPVYDFSSTTGYLIADNILVSNCRCTVFHEIT